MRLHQIFVKGVDSRYYNYNFQIVLENDVWWLRFTNLHPLLIKNIEE